jgi:hypothetical protein
MEKELGTLDDTPFDLILKAQILTPQDFAKLTPLKEELRETFLKSQVFRTRTEMEVSVLNDIVFPTPSAKYWQAVREQNVMFNELVSLSYEYRKNIIEIKKLKRSLEKEIDDLERELIQIQIEKQIFTLRNQEKIAKDRIRELAAWSEIKHREAQKMAPEELVDVDTHQLVSYTKRWIGQYAVMGEGASPSERRNIIGQLKSGLRVCREKGLTELVLDGLTPEFQNELRKW